MKDENKPKLTVYEQDKKIVKDLPPFDKRELGFVYEDLVDFIKEHEETTYFMLNSKKLSYYTIFKWKSSIARPELVAKEIIDFILNDSYLTTLGELKVFRRHSEGTIEIWIGETHFMLFTADDFFIVI